MTLTQWNPIRDLVQLQDRINRVFSDAFGRGGDEADPAGIVLPGGVEGCSCNGRGVSSVEATGTGRVDPLPIGGHGAS